MDNLDKFYEKPSQSLISSGIWLKGIFITNPRRINYIGVFSNENGKLEVQLVFINRDSVVLDHDVSSESKARDLASGYVAQLRVLAK
jgi:hypothetical protein